MIISLILVLVGLTAITALLSGTDPVSGSPLDSTRTLLYTSVAFLAFAYVSFSVLRVRRSYSITGFPPGKVMSIVRCAQCSFKQIKNFTLGDYVYKTVGQCTQCGSPSLFINGIYTEDKKH